MFVKKNVKKDGEKTWTYYHIVESYKDSEGVTKHNYLANISSLPEKDVQAIKKYLRGELVPKDQPVYHRLWGRIRAHVLICFLAYYLSWWMSRELKDQGITTELPTVLDRWDQLYLSEMKVQTDGDSITQWN
jgi:hypothetical protein